MPRWGGPDPRALAAKVQAEGGFAITLSGLRHWVPVPKAAAPFLPALAAERSFGEIAKAARMDWFAFAATFGPAYRALVGANLLHCSKGLAR